MILKLLKNRAIPAVTDFYVTNSGEGNTITPLELMSLPLAEGNKIYFNRGEEFEIGDLNITENGIEVGAYGTGDDPIIKGSVDIGSQTWTSEGSNVWSTPYSGTVKWLDVNGAEAQIAESPWYVITSQPNTSNLRATSLISQWGSSIVGAKVIVKEYYFTYSHVLTVTAYDNATGQITLSSPVQTSLIGFSFKLFDQFQFINSTGEWFHDTTANKLYYRTSGSSPAGTDIRVVTKDCAFNISDDVTDSTFSGLELCQFFQAGIKGKGNSRTSISSCNIHNIRQNGIFLYGTNEESTIQGNDISSCGQNAILIGGITDFVISNNTFTDIGVQSSIPFLQKIGSSFTTYEQTLGTGVAFSRDLFTTNVVAQNGTIDNNVMTNLSYCGVVFLGSNHVIEYNEVNGCMSQFIDGGGIYGIKAVGFDPDGNDNIIRKNILHGAVGSMANTDAAWPEGNYAWGVYLDINLTGTIVEDNTIYDCASGGVLVNYGCQGTEIKNNVFVGGLHLVRYYNHTVGAESGKVNNGNILTGNVFAIRSASQYAVDLFDVQGITTYNPYSSGGSAENNYYLNPYSTNLFRQSTGVDAYYTIAAWRTKLSKDVVAYTSVPTYSLTNATYAALEVALNVNTSKSAVLPYTPSDDYVDINNVDITTENIPIYKGSVFIRKTSVRIVLDNFNGTNGTALASHTPDRGGAWTTHSGTNTLNGSGRITGANGNSTIDTGIADALIGVSGRASASGGGINILARHNNGAGGVNNESYIWVAWFGTTIGLYKKDIGGTTTTIASATSTITVGTDYYVELKLEGTRAIVTIGSTQVIDIDDAVNLAFNQSNTRHGVRMSANSNLDYFLVDDIY